MKEEINKMKQERKREKEQLVDKIEEKNRKNGEGTKSETIR